MDEELTAEAMQLGAANFYTQARNVYDAWCELIQEPPSVELLDARGEAVGRRRRLPASLWSAMKADPDVQARLARAQRSSMYFCIVAQQTAALVAQTARDQYDAEFQRA